MASNGQVSLHSAPRPIPVCALCMSYIDDRPHMWPRGNCQQESGWPLKFSSSPASHARITCTVRSATVHGAREACGHSIMGLQDLGISKRSNCIYWACSVCWVCSSWWPPRPSRSSGLHIHTSCRPPVLRSPSQLKRRHHCRGNVRSLSVFVHATR